MAIFAAVGVIGVATVGATDSGAFGVGIGAGARARINSGEGNAIVVLVVYVGRLVAPLAGVALAGSVAFNPLV